MSSTIPARHISHTTLNLILNTNPLTLWSNTEKTAIGSFTQSAKNMQTTTIWDRNTVVFSPLITLTHVCSRVLPSWLLWWKWHFSCGLVLLLDQSAVQQTLRGICSLWNRSGDAPIGLVLTSLILFLVRAGKATYNTPPSLLFFYSTVALRAAVNECCWQTSEPMWCVTGTVPYSATEL